MPVRQSGAVLATLGAVAFAVSACGGGGSAKLTCPTSFVAPDADKVAVFKPGGGTQLADVSYGIKVIAVNSKCDRADKGLIVNTKVDFRLVSNDPALRTGSFTYFVSVVDERQNILTKRTYTMPFEFGSNLHDLQKSDALIEKLPLLNVATGNNYAIVVGLQLTPQQFEFNRASSAPPSLPVPPSQAIPPSAPAPNGS